MINWKAVFRRAGWGSVILSAVAAAVWFLIPDYGEDLSDFSSAVKIYDRNGAELRTSLKSHEIYCEPITLAQAGEWTARAVVAFEDKRFYQHGGIDPAAICRATLGNVAHGKVMSGASTLTTLVVKLTEPRPRSLWTKVVEAHGARELEGALSKDEILEQYINRAPFGGNIVGVEAASRFYFGKPANNLSLAESAMLMGLPQSPSMLRPDRYPERATRQRNIVLWRMYKNGFIDLEQYRNAKRQTMTVLRNRNAFEAPHFCDYMLQNYPINLTLKTTLDLELQVLAERELANQVNALLPYGVQGGAVVVLDVKSGDLLAMVGSPDFQWSQVNGAVSRRSPGSTLKPFAYALALDQGLYTPASVLADVPTDFAGYKPQNYNLEYSGLASVRRSLVQSLNIPALRCVQQVGLRAFMQQLHRLGFSTLDYSGDHYGLGVVVGSCETTLLDLANAYACLARNGLHLPVRVLEDDAHEEPARVLSEEAAYMLADMLGGEERTEWLNGHYADVALPRVAWKTGTSSGHRDAWTIAYNPEYVVGVWLGNPDGSPSEKLVGGSAAAPVAGALFRCLYPDGISPWYEKPAAVKTRPVCARSGLLPNRYCPTVEEDYCISRVSHTKRCTVHGLHGEQWPADIQNFFADRGMSDEEKISTRRCRIASPLDGETFHLLTSDVLGQQELKLSGSSEGELFWFINGKPFGSGTELFWPIAKGRHTIACADAQGYSDQVRIVVE